MHILQGLLIPLLAAAPCRAASPAAPYAGSWKGAVTVSPAECRWDTRVQVAEKEGVLSGTFTYSGPCGEGLRSGTFTAVPAGGSCYDARAGLPGLPKFSARACLDAHGNLSFEGLVFKGNVILTEKARRADLQSSSALGSAAGTFRKVTLKASKAAARKGKTGETDSKVSTHEIFIGRN